MDREGIRRIAAEFTELKVSQAGGIPFARRHGESVLKELRRQSAQRAVLLEGPRRSGKSTILFQVLARLRTEEPDRPAVALDLEDARLSGTSVREVAEALLQSLPPASDPVLLLDEVHNAAGWDADLKWLIDHTAARYVVADSCAAMVRAGVRERGVGRWIRIPVHPLSLGEWWSLRSAQGITPPTSDLERAEDCKDYLRSGGFPAHASDRNLLRIHELLRADVVDQAARRDLASVHGLRDPASLEQLLVSRIANSGGELGARQAAELANTSERSARHWLRTLMDTGLLWELHRWGRSAGKHERARPKVYAVDPGLVAACSVPVFGDAGGNVAGRLLETAVGQGLRAHAERSAARIGFHPRNGGRETDFVYEQGKFLAVVEVTATRDAKKIASLSRRAQAVGADWAGVVSYRAVTERHTTTSGDIHLVPAHAFLYALAEDRPEDLAWPPPVRAG